MLRSVQLDRNYSPEIVAVMDAAFDNVCQSLSAGMMNVTDETKSTLAVIILRLVDGGERDSGQIAEIAYREWTATGRPAIGARRANG
jgi:hypothetical protein